MDLSLEDRGLNKPLVFFMVSYVHSDDYRDNVKKDVARIMLANPAIGLKELSKELKHNPATISTFYHKFRRDYL